MRRLLLALMLPASAAMAQDPPAHTPAEDCAVIAGIIRDSPKTMLDTPWSAHSHGADCDWQGLGVTAPKISTDDVHNSDHGVALSFSQPNYADGGTKASITFYVSGWTKGRIQGSQEHICDLTRRDGVWHLFACRTGIIAD